MGSKLTIQQRMDHAAERKESTLNLSFHFDDILEMMKRLDVKEDDGVGKLSKAIVGKILYGDYGSMEPADNK